MIYIGRLNVTPEDLDRWEIEVSNEWSDHKLAAAISSGNYGKKKLHVLEHVQEQRAISKASRNEEEERGYKEHAQATAEESNKIAAAANNIAKDARTISFIALIVAVVALILSFARNN